MNFFLNERLPSNGTPPSCTWQTSASLLCTRVVGILPHICYGTKRGIHLLQATERRNADRQVIKSQIALHPTVPQQGSSQGLSARKLCMRFRLLPSKQTHHPWILPRGGPCRVYTLPMGYPCRQGTTHSYNRERGLLNDEGLVNMETVIRMSSFTKYLNYASCLTLMPHQLYHNLLPSVTTSCFAFASADRVN